MGRCLRGARLSREESDSDLRKQGKAHANNGMGLFLLEVGILDKKDYYRESKFIILYGLRGIVKMEKFLYN